MHRIGVALGSFVLTLALTAFLTPAAFAAGDAAAGKKLFDTYCFTCHGLDGKGDGPAGAALNPPPRNFVEGHFKFDANKDGKVGEDADLALVIKNGAAAYGGNPAMAPWGSQFSDQQIQDLIAYIRTFHTSKK
jgi:mono/diheme cytochrome c family protein